MRKAFSKGLVDGLPIGIGYLSVSFGFGISAAALNIPTLFAWLISATNLTSAGQAAGIEIIAACGTLLEMALTQLVINLRYALMGFSLTQKLDSGFTTIKRLILSFGITDEIYATAISREGKISPSYMLGLIVLPYVGWTSGTVLGSIAGEMLTPFIANAMGILLYGMFIAIFVPSAKKSKPVLLTVIISAALSLIFKFLLPSVSFGFAIIISALVSSAICAALFPIKEAAE